MLTKHALKILITMIATWIISLVAIVQEYNSYYTKNMNKMKNNNIFLKNAPHYIIKQVLHEKYEDRFGNGSSIEEVEIQLNLSQETLDATKGYDMPPGTDGRKVILRHDLKPKIKADVKEGWKNHGFNQFVSDMIPVTRELPDVRNERCTQKNYWKIILQASVVICFHNEAWSTLMRTVFSVLKTSEDHLLKEIILFDDFSWMDHLQDPLNEYIEKIPKVTLVKSAFRRGLIKARMAALDYVTAPVVVFLDSHCECTKGWLEPLINRIQSDSTRVVSPVIDEIDGNTFGYIPRENLRIGGFNWDLTLTWNSIQSGKRLVKKNLSAPYRTPVIPGIFAVHKIFFDNLGGYDEGFDFWGGENLELSFRTWMCGGTMEIIPCSHIGHVRRNRFLYKGQLESFQKNAARLAEVWMDDYAKYYYERIGNTRIDIGDMSGRKLLRKNLQCNSFNWYLQNVYKTMEIPKKSVARGRISLFLYNICLDGTSNVNIQQRVRLLPCHYRGGNQFWIYTKEGFIQRDNMCLDYFMGTITLLLCDHKQPEQVWIYVKKTKHIVHPHTQLCLHRGEVNNDEDYITLYRCSKHSAQQKWLLENFDDKILQPKLQKLAERNRIRL